MRKMQRQLHVEELEARALLSGAPGGPPLGTNSGVFTSASVHPAAALAAPGGMPTAAEVAAALKLVEADLDNHNGSWASVHVVTNDALYQEFPHQIFISVVFRQYPLGQIVPAPYQSADIYAVTRGPLPQLQLLTSAKSLQVFFRSRLPAVTTQSGAREAVRAWLALSPLLLQDGFYTFQLITDSVKAKVGHSGLQASGKVVVMAGGNGMIDATLTFNAGGQLTAVSEHDHLVPGPRPICQSTKLLHRDPLVRRMAEQDLLIMGRAARDYLAEQRARAAPKLQRAIDRMWQRICAAGRCGKSVPVATNSRSPRKQ